MRQFLVFPALCFLSWQAALPFLPQSNAVAGDAADSPEVAALKRLGARVESDATKPGKPIVKISLRNTKATDADLEYVSRLKTLRALDLSHTDIGNEGLARLKGLDQLEELNLAFTRITDEGLISLRPMINLKSLDLERPCKGEYTPANRLTDKALVHLKGLARLESLNLDWNMVTDTGLAHLETMTSLRELTLGFQTGVTIKGRANLQARLPNAKIR